MKPEGSCPGRRGQRAFGADSASLWSWDHILGAVADLTRPDLPGMVKVSCGLLADRPQRQGRTRGKEKRDDDQASGGG